MHNFGTFGVQIGYDLFDGGKRNATIGQQRAQLAKAEENLAHITEEVELRVQTAYNKLERTRQMMKVSEELLAVRTESHVFLCGNRKKAARFDRKRFRQRPRSCRRKPLSCNRNWNTYRQMTK